MKRLINYVFPSIFCAILIYFGLRLLSIDGLLAGAIANAFSVGIMAGRFYEEATRNE